MGPGSYEVLLNDAAKEAGISFSNLAKKAKEGKIDAKKIKNRWKLSLFKKLNVPLSLMAPSGLRGP